MCDNSRLSRNRTVIVTSLIFGSVTQQLKLQTPGNDILPSTTAVFSYAIGSRKLSEGADRVAGQLRGDKECPFSGVTKCGRVWRKVPESDARSVTHSPTHSLSLSHTHTHTHFVLTICVVFSLFFLYLNWWLLAFQTTLSPHFTESN